MASSKQLYMQNTIIYHIVISITNKVNENVNLATRQDLWPIFCSRLKYIYREDHRISQNKQWSDIDI
jgi:hypothetical protein